MKRLALLLSTALMLATTPATAKEEKKEAGGQNVPVSPVAIPVVVGGKVVNYVFVQVRIELTGSANASKLRDKEPYFRDALVRAAHRTPFTLPSDLTKVDEARITAVLMREAQAIAGADVRGVTVMSQAPKSLRVSTAR